MDGPQKAFTTTKKNQVVKKCFTKLDAQSVLERKKILFNNLKIYLHLKSSNTKNQTNDTDAFMSVSATLMLNLPWPVN